jgi:hypothetical protein
VLNELGASDTNHTIKETKMGEEKPVQDGPEPGDKDFDVDLLFAMAEELIWAEAVEENESYLRYKRENPS